ncbi:MAG: alpha/beta hydrolase [Pseudomonadota bacterium]
MAVLEVGDHRIGYHEAGREDAPLVIFAHCSLGHGGLWRGVMAALSEDWRCVAADLPGHGQSTRGETSISLQDQAARDVAALASELGDGRAHLVGLSLGGAIMARAAIRIPGLARSLAMLEPILMHLLKDTDPEMAEDNHRLMKPVVDACAEERWRDGAKAFMDNWGQPGQFEKFPEAAKAAVAEAMKWISRDFPMAHSYVAGQIDRADLGDIAVPTVLMQGERTQPSAKAVVTEVAGAVSQAEIVELPGVGHLSPVEDPTLVASRLAPFLRAAEAAA